MILRRVITHVRNQEWTAIGIDFLIVVLGVFVGIQVSNWNAARADVRLGQAYVARLLTDLHEDRENLARLRAIAAGVPAGTPVEEIMSKKDHDGASVQ